MTGYTFELGRVINGVQLVNLTLHQFDENDYVGRVFTGECPVCPALIDGVIVDAPQYVKEVLAGEAYAADLASNGERYVLENQYIILCDALRQALGQTATHEKIGFDVLPVMMLTLKAGSKDAYEKLRDAMDMVNSALIRYEVKWWDTAVYHSQPELQAASLKILELAQ
jgi:hypothetical protein